MYCINRVKHFIDAVSLKKLYYSTIHSNISYGINVYSSANSTTLEKLRKKNKSSYQNKFVTQTIEPIACLSHTVPLFQSKTFYSFPIV